ncbi:MAG TPA: DUF3887 domain-containing protein, partial [Verrucomicrobium sp.]|nr:DUF3887 domain-containing protein [Verrucomicrobium sp.]
MKTFLHRMAAVVSQLLLTIMPAAAKTGDQEAHDQMSRQIQELYNTGNYAGIHDLLTTGFQAQFDRAKVEAFFGQVLQPTYGKFDVITFLKKEGASRLYKVAAEKGVATLSLAVDDQNKIAGMKFVPGDPKAEVKRPLRAEPA